jgi:hypothetical protein
VLLDGWIASARVSADHPAPLGHARTLDELQRWAEGDFAGWLVARREALTSAERALRAVTEAGRPAHEQAVAAALAGRLYDEYAHDLLRVVPVVDDLAEDDELLGIFAAATWDAAGPLLRTARERYAACAERLEGAPEGWWIAWRDSCRDRAALLARAPERLAPSIVRERLHAQSRDDAARTTVPSTIAALTPPRASNVPRALREDVAALDALVLGRLAMDAGESAAPHWERYRARHPALMRDVPPVAAVLDALLEAVQQEYVDPYELRGRQAELVPEALDLADRTRSCWVSRSAALGTLALDYEEARDDHALARWREQARRERFEARQREHLQRARAMAALDGDALIQAALILAAARNAELPYLLTQTVRTAAARYASSGRESERDALRDAARLVAASPLPRLDPDPAVRAEEDRAAHLRAIFDALGRSPAEGARQLAQELAVDRTDLDRTTLDRATWGALAERCR